MCKDEGWMIATFEHDPSGFKPSQCILWGSWGSPISKALCDLSDLKIGDSGAKVLRWSFRASG